MKKKLLLFVASITTAMGMTLLVLSLSLVLSSVAFAQTEASNCSNGTCTRYLNSCSESNCMASYSGCECGTALNCVCKAANTKR